MRLKRPTPTAAFTLIELLSVVAIVGVLGALVITSVARTRSLAQQSKCLTSLRSTFTAAQLYATDHQGAIVPGSVKNEQTGGNADLWSASLFPYYGVESNAASDKFACPRWEDDKVSATAYNWGYAMNLTPGYEGSVSTSAQKAASVIVHKTDGSTTGTTFRVNTITHPAKRLFFCDSNQWHIRGQHIENDDSLVSYDRHGPDKCNVIFFDGHVATLTPGEVDLAIYNPGSN